MNNDPYVFGVNYPPTAPVADLTTGQEPGQLGEPKGTTYGRTLTRKVKP